MQLTSFDIIAIRDLLKQVENILGEYNESPYDQIDNLRAKICEAQDIAEDTSSYSTEESAFDEASNQLEHDFYMANR